MADKHHCEPMKPSCCCYMLADEPSWKCAIHGGAIVNRCECGRFVRAKAYFGDRAELSPTVNERSG